MLLLFETAAGYALFTVEKGEKRIKKTDVRPPPRPARAPPPRGNGARPPPGQRRRRGGRGGVGGPRVAEGLRALPAVAPARPLPARTHAMDGG